MDESGRRDAPTPRTRGGPRRPWGTALAMVGLVNRNGIDTVAAYGIVQQLWGYVQMPAMAIGAAVSAMAAQNIGAGRWDRVARITRAATLSLSQREYVVAARSLGASNLRIMREELLPNIALAMMTFGLVAVAAAIVGEASLSFLGLSIPPPDPSWGGMIAAGRSEIATAPWVCLIPAGVLFLTVLCLNVVGDHVRARFDVRESSL